MKPSTILYLIVGYFALINIADAITALFILDGEANPLFIYFQSLWPVVILKVIAVAFFIVTAIRKVFPSNFTIFMFLTTVMLANIILTIAVYGNVQGILHPEVLEYAASVPNEEKIENYNWFVFFFFVLPYMINIFTFYLYEKVYPCIEIRPTNNINRKWWQIWKY